MFVLIGVELNTTQKLQLVDALSPLHAGLIIIVMALAAFPASVLGGANLHRVGFLPLIAGGFFGTAAGTLLLAAGAQFAGLALMGVSAGAIMSVSSIAIIGAAPLHRSGMAAGVEEVSYEFGTLLAVAITGSLMGRWAETQTYVDAYEGVMVVLAVASASMALVSLWCFAGNPKSGDLHP